MKKIFEGYIEEITLEIKNIYLEDKIKRGMYQSARLVSEAICKLILLNEKFIKSGNNETSFNFIKDGQEYIIGIDLNGGFNYKTPLNYRFRSLELEVIRYIVDKENYINDKNVYYALDNFRQKGNKASHANAATLRYTDKDKEEIKENINLVINWLFQEYLKRDLPQEIIRIFTNKPAIMSSFKPLNLVIDNTNPKIFENDLIYYDENSKSNIDKIIELLEKNKQALLTGGPGCGKTVGSFYIAKIFENKGYQTYYFSFLKNQAYNLFEDIKENINRKVIFVIDDCDLNQSKVKDIYKNCEYLTQDKNAPTVNDNEKIKTENKQNCLILYISKKISSNEANATLKADSQFEYFEKSTVDLMKDVQPTALFEGIINKYQQYYKNKHNKEYLIGGIEEVKQNCYQDLSMLSLTLDEWETSGCELSQIDRKKILATTYDSYSEKFNAEAKKAMLKYASAYLYEVPFEVLLESEIEKNAETLVKNSIIRKNDDNHYFFYSGLYARLIIDSYWNVNSSLLERKYDQLTNYIFENLKEYLSDFNKYGYKYPDNLNLMLKSLADKDVELYIKIIRDNEIRPIAVRFYKENFEKPNGDYYLINFFYMVLISHIKEIKSIDDEKTSDAYDLDNLKYYYSEIIKNNEKFKSFFIKNLNIDNYLNFWDYNNFICNYVSDKTYDFREIFTEDEVRKLFIKKYYDDIINIPHDDEEFDISICSILNFVNHSNYDDLSIQEKEERRIFLSIDNNYLIKITNELNVIDIFKIFNKLHILDHDKTAEIYTNIDCLDFSGYVSDEYFKFCEAFVQLAELNKEKTVELIKTIDSKDFAEFLKISCFNDIGYPLGNINLVCPEKAAEILMHLSIDDLVYIYTNNASYEYFVYGDEEDTYRILSKIDPAKMDELKKQLLVPRLIDKIKKFNKCITETSEDKLSLLISTLTDVLKLYSTYPAAAAEFLDDIILNKQTINGYKLSQVMIIFETISLICQDKMTKLINEFTNMDLENMLITDDFKEYNTEKAAEFFNAIDPKKFQKLIRKIESATK